MAISEDASTPVAVTKTGANNPVTAAFSPPANSLLVALCDGGWASSAPEHSTVTDSLGGTWTKLVEASNTDAANGGVAAIWCRYLTTAPGSMTVTATFSPWGGGALLAVRVLLGASSSQSSATTATYISGTTDTTTTGQITYTPTTVGSWVYGCTDSPTTNSTTTYTALSGTTIIKYTNNTTDQTKYSAWRATAATSSLTSTTYGGTYNAINESCVALFEVLPAATGQTVALGLAAETDTTYTLTRAKARSLGLATETDAALALIEGRAMPLGLASEADATTALSVVKAIPTWQQCIRAGKTASSNSYTY